MVDITISNIVNFFLDPLFLKIIEITFLVFLGMWLLWKTYMHLSKKNLFEIHRPKDHDATFVNKAVYWIKYIFVLPLLVFFWFALFVLCFKVLTYKSDVKEIMFFGIVLISATRAAAYFNEKMAEDLAKMLPLTMLAAIIMSPSFISINLKWEDFLIFREEFFGFAKYLLFIIFLEFGLKVAVYIKKKFTKKQE